MFSLIVVLTFTGFNVPDITTERQCVRLMTTIQRHVSPEKIVLLVCERTREQWL